MEFLKKFDNETDYKLALDQLDQFAKDGDFNNAEDLKAFNKLANLVNKYEKEITLLPEMRKFTKEEANRYQANLKKLSKPTGKNIFDTEEVLNKQELKDFLLNAMVECEKERDDNYYRGKYNALKAVYLCFIKENI